MQEATTRLNDEMKDIRGSGDDDMVPACVDKVEDLGVASNYRVGAEASLKKKVRNSHASACVPL